MDYDIKSSIIIQKRILIIRNKLYENNNEIID